MGKAKQIRLKVIPAKVANPFVKKHHYSGKVVNNSNLHFGAFLDGKLHGVMSFGSPLDKRKVLGLVEGTLWNEMLELNRMAFDDHLPRNSESRCIAIAIKLLKKNAPHIKWILSFSDATQCGDGIIYRASGFMLTQIKANDRLIIFPDGLITHGINLHPRASSRIAAKYNPNNKTENALFKEGKFEYIKGFQLRYIKLLRNNLKLTVPIIPFSKIDEMGAGMYKGKPKISASSSKVE